MHVAGEMLWGFQSGLDECLVDDNFRRNVGEFPFLPRFHLLAHRFEVSLHSIHADGDAVDERERL